MRITALAGLFALILISANSSSASAEALELLQPNKIETTLQQPLVSSRVNAQRALLPQAQPPAPAEPKVVKYKVAENDSLTTIANAHNTTWKRLFDKNESIQHPDVIKAGDELTIPGADETLKDRPLPEPPQEPVVPPQAVVSTPAVSNKRPVQQAAPKPKATARAAVQTRGAVAGNTYTPGYCTWYVKNKRPDLPNNLGNADTWVARARAQGIPTGSAPRVGAAGQRGMHVVYVEAVNGDGTVTISEMNHAGLYVITRRTLPASYFTYIY